MSDTDIQRKGYVAYRLLQTGMALEPIKYEQIPEYFVSVNILVFYFLRTKRYYVWVGENATRVLQNRIPIAKDLLLMRHPDINILRNFTVDSFKSATFDLLDLLHIDRDQYKSKMEKWETIRQTELKVIDTLQTERDTFYDKLEYDPAIAKAQEIIEKGQKIYDNDIVENNKKFIRKAEKVKAAANKGEAERLTAEREATEEETKRKAAEEAEQAHITEISKNKGASAESQVYTFLEEAANSIVAFEFEKAGHIIEKAVGLTQGEGQEFIRFRVLDAQKSLEDRKHKYEKDLQDFEKLKTDFYSFKEERAWEQAIRRLQLIIVMLPKINKSSEEMAYRKELDETVKAGKEDVENKSKSRNLEEQQKMDAKIAASIEKYRAHIKKSLDDRNLEEAEKTNKELQLIVQKSQKFEVKEDGQKYYDQTHKYIEYARELTRVMYQINEGINISKQSIAQNIADIAKEKLAEARTLAEKFQLKEPLEKIAALEAQLLGKGDAEKAKADTEAQRAALLTKIDTLKAEIHTSLDQKNIDAAEAKNAELRQAKDGLGEDPVKPEVSQFCDKTQDYINSARKLKAAITEINKAIPECEQMIDNAKYEPCESKLNDLIALAKTNKLEDQKTKLVGFQTKLAEKKTGIESNKAKLNTLEQAAKAAESEHRWDDVIKAYDEMIIIAPSVERKTEVPQFESQKQAAAQALEGKQKKILDEEAQLKAAAEAEKAKLEEEKRQRKVTEDTEKAKYEEKERQRLAEEAKKSQQAQYLAEINTIKTAIQAAIDAQNYTEAQEKNGILRQKASEVSDPLANASLIEFADMKQQEITNGKKRIEAAKVIEQKFPECMALMEKGQLDFTETQLKVLIDLAEANHVEEAKPKLAELKVKLEETKAQNKVNTDKFAALERDVQDANAAHRWEDAGNGYSEIIALLPAVQREQEIAVYEAKKQDAMNKAAEEAEKDQKMDQETVIIETIDRLKQQIQEAINKGNWTVAEKLNLDRLAKAKESTNLDTQTAAQQYFDETDQEITASRKKTETATLIDQKLTECDQKIENLAFEDASSLLTDMEQTATECGDQARLAHFKGLQSKLNAKQTEFNEAKEKHKAINDHLIKTENEERWNDAITACDEMILLLPKLHKDNEVIHYQERRTDLVTKQAESQKNAEAATKITTLIQLSEDARIKKDYPMAQQRLSEALEIAKNSKNISKMAEIKTFFEKIASQQEEDSNRQAICEKLEKTIAQNEADKHWTAAIENNTKIISLFNRPGDETNRITYEKKLQEFKDIKAEEQKKSTEREQLAREEAKKLDKMMVSDPEVMPTIEEITLDDALGTLSTDAPGIFDRMDNILNAHRVEIKNEAQTKTVVRTSSGEVVELQKTTKIEAKEPSKSPGMEATGPISYSLSSGLENTFDSMIEEAVLTDMVPYNFEITEIKINGKSPKKEPEKVKTTDGLQVTWKLQNIAPQEKVAIDYDLRRRVSRTALIPLKSQLKIIKTHANMNPLKIEGLYDALLEFSNNFDQILQNIVIEDIIPPFYVYDVKKPVATPHKDHEENAGSLVKWQLKTVEENANTTHLYQLLDLYRFEELKIKVFALDKKAFDALENYQVDTGLWGYKDVLKILRDYK